MYEPDTSPYQNPSQLVQFITYTHKHTHIYTPFYCHILLRSSTFNSGRNFGPMFTKFGMKSSFYSLMGQVRLQKKSEILVFRGPPN